MPSLTAPNSNDIDQEIELFLDQVSEKYIDDMSRDGVWGGDLEIGAIANLLNIKIEVYKESINSTAQSPVGPENAPNTIKLLLIGEASGNGHYSVINNDKTITSITGDGNCLFNACVTANQPQSIQTIQTAAELRKAVCEYLKKQQTMLPEQAKAQQQQSITDRYISAEDATDADLNKRIKESNPIRSRFFNLIMAENAVLEDFKSILPDTLLRNKAIELRQKRIENNNLIDTARKKFFEKYKENIQSNTQLNNITQNISQDAIQIHDTQNTQQPLATIKQDAIECPILPNQTNLITEQQQLFIEFLKTQIELNQDPKEPLIVEANNFYDADLAALKQLLTEQKINIKLKLPNIDDYIYQPTNTNNPPKPK